MNCTVQENFAMDRANVSCNRSMCISNSYVTYTICLPFLVEIYCNKSKAASDVVGGGRGAVIFSEYFWV